MEMHLYRPQEVKKQSFKKSKVHAIPSQSMTLKEILQRFVRRETLPVAREGTYSVKFGDLEKLAKEDITVQMDRVEDIKSKVKKAQKRMQDAEDARIKAEVERKAIESMASKKATDTKPDASPEQ